MWFGCGTCNRPGISAKCGGRVLLIKRHELSNFAVRCNYITYFRYTFGNENADDIA